MTASEVRSCFNDLARSWDGPEVTTELKRIVFGQRVCPGAIVDLRTAVQQELGPGNGRRHGSETSVCGKKCGGFWEARRGVAGDQRCIGLRRVSIAGSIAI